MNRTKHKESNLKNSSLNKSDLEFLKKMIEIDTTDSKNSEKLFKLIDKFILPKFEKLKVKSSRGHESLVLIYKNTTGPFLLIDSHYDVVPALSWKNAFKPIIKNGFLYGRGSNDNKGLILPVLKALNYVVSRDIKLNLIFSITSDEEKEGYSGAYAVAKILKEKNIDISNLIILEPTNLKRFGEKIKIGFRGRALIELNIVGTSHHASRPFQLNNNPLIDLSNMLLLSLDSENNGFPGDSTNMDKTTFSITSIKANNKTTNATPSMIQLLLDVRYNSKQNERSIKSYLTGLSNSSLIKISRYIESYSPVLSKDISLSKILQKIIYKNSKVVPELSTSGGGSNASAYLKYFNASFSEFGTTIYDIHSNNERVSLNELELLTKVLIDLFETLNYHNT